MTIQVYPATKSQVSSNFWRYTAVGGETTLTGVDSTGTSLYYYPNQEQIFLNGVLLVRGVDYTATSGTSITGLAALVAGDTVQVNCYSNFTITQIPVTALQGSITNLQLANSSITIGGQTINLGGSQSTFSGITLTAPTLNNPVISTTATGAAPLTINGIASQTGDYLDINTLASGGTNIFRIDSSGNVGVGTVASAKLHVVKAGPSLQTAAIFDNTDTTGTSGTPNAIKVAFAQGGNIKASINAGTYGYDYLAFNTGTDTERGRFDAMGNFGVGTTTPITYNSNTSYTKVLSLKAQGDQVLTLGSYWQAGVGQYSYINSSQSTSATNASYLIIQTGQVEAMRVDTSQNVMVGTTSPIGKLTVGGALSTTTFSPDQTLTLTSATTYSANTAYTIGNISVSTSSTFICQLIISMDNTGYHHYVGTFLLPMVFWKASGTTFTYNFVMEQHNGNNANATITLPVGYSSSRPITFQTDQSITVASGGAVTLYVKRIF
jgi:hypothetical protein